MQIAEAIDEGLQFLAARQLPSGQFPVELTYYDSQTGATAVRQDPSIFASIHVAYSLDLIQHPSAQAMVSRTLTYFLDQMSGHGLWHYWNKAAVLRGLNLHKFIPADLDDMAG